MMVVPIIGGHGSGKSTMVERIAGSYDVIEWVMDPAQMTKTPVGMRLASRAGGSDLFVVGAYAGQTMSGVDSGRFAGRLDEIYGWIRAAAARGESVLFEGAIVSGAWRRLVELSREANVTVAYLDVPVGVCLDALAGRKRERVGGHKNSSKPVNVERVSSHHRSVAGAVARLKAHGVTVVSGDRLSLADAIKVLL